MPHQILGVICTSTGWGGLELNTLRLIRWLCEAGWKAHLLTAGGTPLHQHAQDEPSSLSTFGEESLPGRSGQLRVMHVWMLRYKIRVLLVPYNKDIAVASLYKRFYNRDIGFIYQQHMQVGVRKRDLIHTLRYTMIDIWIAPLQYLKEEVLRLTRVPEEKIQVIPFGMELERLINTPWTRAAARATLSLPEDAFLIGVLGRLDPKKGQDLVIRALEQLRRDNYEKIHVLLMGDATVREGDTFGQLLHEMVRDNGLEAYVHFWPFAADVMMFFRAIDVFAMPSHGETFGMVTIEAMAAGVPVIGTNNDGTREILGEGKFGVLFEKDDVAGFCCALQTMRNDPAPALRIETARNQALTQYTKEKMVSNINDLLLSLVQQESYR